jgi:GAF domain-containing protein
MVNESVKQPQASEHRAVMAEALNTALEVFTAQAEPTFDGIMTNGLWPIADAAGIDRVAINRFFDEDPDRPFGQVYCWAREAGGTTSVDERLRRIPSNHPATARWLSIISADECTVATLSDANEEEAAFMDSFGLKTVVITPIFIHGRLWGFAVFGDLARERHFDGVSLAFLRSAAFLCANMVLRYEMEREIAEGVEALEHREKMLDAMNKAAISLLSPMGDTFEDSFQAGMAHIAKCADIDRVCIW